MPSGAKKRKAAKKKKEQESQITSPTNNPQEYDDVKSQDEKGSDGGEVNSPSNQDNHYHHHSFSEAKEELGEKDSSSVTSVDVEDKSLETASSEMKDTQKVGLQDDGLIEIERDLKSDEPSDSKNMSIEYLESAKEFHYNGDKSSSSSSSSDDEFQEFTKKGSNQSSNLGPDATSRNDWFKSVESSAAKVAQITENGAPNGKSFESVTEVSYVVESEKPVVPVPVETVSVIENAPIENSVVSDVIESDLENDAVKSLTSGAPLLSSTKTEGQVVPLTDENAKASSTTLNSAVSDVIENSVASDVLESGLENGAVKSSTTGAPLLSPTKTESQEVPLTDENAKASSTMLEPRRKESKDETIPKSGALAGQAVNDTKRIQDFEIPESSENQSLVAPTPKVSQRTSWLSCCGIFDLLAGSSR